MSTTEPKKEKTPKPRAAKRRNFSKELETCVTYCRANIEVLSEIEGFQPNNNDRTAGKVAAFKAVLRKLGVSE